LLVEHRADEIPRDRLPALMAHLAALQAVIAARLLEAPENGHRTTPGADDPPVEGDEAEYLSIRQLAQRIPYAERTLRNLMSQGALRLGEHYFKPNGRVVFKWSAVRAWCERRAGPTP
jgi:hypothetical protein